MNHFALLWLCLLLVLVFSRSRGFFSQSSCLLLYKGSVVGLGSNTSGLLHLCVYLVNTYACVPAFCSPFNFPVVSFYRMGRGGELLVLSLLRLLCCFHLMANNHSFC